MIRKKTAVIFDMDGVIIDSNPLVVKAWKSFFQSHNIRLTKEEFSRYVFGRTSKDTIQTVFKGPIDEETMYSYRRQIDGAVRDLSSKEGRIVKGVTSFVEALIAEDIALAIATSAPIENVTLVLELAGCTAYFNIIVDASQVKYAKPHPEVYLLAAEKSGIATASCCVFEDSFSGIQAAKAAGMKVVGVATTHTPQELENEVDKVIDDFTQISPAAVDALIRSSNYKND